MTYFICIFFSVKIFCEKRRSKTKNKRHDKKYHKYKQCNSCGDSYKTHALRTHLKTCQGRRCENCHHVYTVRLFNQHVQFCQEKTQELTSIAQIQQVSDFSEGPSLDSSRSSANLSNSITSDQTSIHIADSLHTSESNLESSPKTDDLPVGFGNVIDENPDEDKDESDSDYHGDDDDSDDDLDEAKRLTQEKYLAKKRRDRENMKVKTFFTNQLQLWEKTLNLSIEKFILTLLQWSIEVCKIRIGKDELNQTLILNGYIPLGTFQK